ncbi:hypothetical protein Tco_0086986 [Tanacetum coccineum]
MIAWIMECVSSTSYPISIIGVLHGFFKGKRGLRQGDPMFPYIFTLIMEFLTLILHRSVKDSNSFTYHHYCSKLNIINLCFANDLFLFAHGDVSSAKLTRCFLWCQGDMRRWKSKVAWEVVCLPKKEGGLGLRRLNAFNKVLNASHIWSILSLKELLWVKWIYTYKLKALEVTYLAYLVFTLMDIAHMDHWLQEGSSVLGRQSQLAYYIPKAQLLVGFKDICSIKRFFPIGVLVQRCDFLDGSRVEMLKMDSVIMDAPPSPNHVFNFPEEEFEEDPQEEPEEEFEEDPEEDPEEEPEVEAEEDSSSDTEAPAPIVADGALEVPPAGSTYEVGGPSSISPFPPYYLHGREFCRGWMRIRVVGLSNVKYLVEVWKQKQS